MVKSHSVPDLANGGFVPLKNIVGQSSGSCQAVIKQSSSSHPEVVILSHQLPPSNQNYVDLETENQFNLIEFLIPALFIWVLSLYT